MGPVVKQIMDHPRCAQLREGDIILEVLHHRHPTPYILNDCDDVMPIQVNGEQVRTYMHGDLVTVLKRCPKGNQATFTLLRHPQEVYSM